jgi:hypothetical protein
MRGRAVRHLAAAPSAEWRLFARLPSDCRFHSAVGWRGHRSIKPQQVDRKYGVPRLPLALRSAKARLPQRGYERKLLALGGDA